MFLLQELLCFWHHSDGGAAPVYFLFDCVLRGALHDLPAALLGAPGLLLLR